MKNIKSIIFLFATLASAPLTAGAQTEAEADDSTAAERKVHVAFRQMNEGDILGGVSVVDYEELAKKDNTTYSLHDMDGLIGGWNGTSLWGLDTDNMDTNDSYGVLCLVDGVARASNNVQPSEISEITFLKGAQAVVLYGAKAAKGAILITTKRGKVDGLRIDANVNTGWYVAKALPEYLGSAEYMTLYNEALWNDNYGANPRYSATDIYNHAAGINPARYTDINYYSSDYIRKAYNRTEATVEVQGGAKRAHFYANVNYYNYGDLRKYGDWDGAYTDRFSVRGNVDVIINNFITGYANASATFYNGRSGKGNLWDAAATVRPNFPQGAAPLISTDLIDPNATAAWDLIKNTQNLIDGKYFLGGTQETMSNVLADGYASGTSQFVSRQFQFDAGVNFDLGAVTKGLSFKTMFSVDYATSYNLSYDNKYAIYVPTWSNYNGKDVIVGLTKLGDEEHSGVQNTSGTSDRQTITWNGHFDYERTFGGVHNVSAMFVGNMWQVTKSGSYHRYSNANLGIQADYNYDRRYYVNFGGAFVHSARLPEGKRGAFSPSVSVGWRLGNEKFIKGSAVDDLMLSLSYSNLHEDMDLVMNSKQFYLYESLWATAYAYGWNDGFSKQYTYSTQGTNPDLTYLTRQEFSVNLRGSFFKKLITADFSFFTNKMSGYLINNPTTFPSHLATGYPDGSFKPVINNDVNTRTGFDFSVKLQKQFGDFYAALGVSGTYFDSKISVKDENYGADTYRNRQGHPIDGLWGLQSMGLFKDDMEVANAPKQNLGSTAKAGDIRYVDQNGDGVIDSKDEVYLGKGGWYGAPFTLGINITLKYKGFTLFLLGTGGFGAYGFKDSSYYKISGDSKYSAVVRDRAQLALGYDDAGNAYYYVTNMESAKFPRLSAQNAANNFAQSDYWMYKTDRFNLSRVQLTYDFPAPWFTNKVVKGVGVYVMLQDLLTISAERKHLETNVGSAPQTRYYNLGVKVAF